MSFSQLNREELQSVVTFFNKDLDLKVADEDKGPTKKELVAALASGDPDAEAEGERPVTWDDYQKLYVPSREAAQVKAKNNAPDLTSAKQPEPELDVAEDDDDKELVKFTGKNPRFDIAGFTFSKDHPFRAVPSAKVSYLVSTGLFRPATGDEVADYYN